MTGNEVMEVKEKRKLLLHTMYNPNNIEIISPLAAAPTSCHDFSISFLKSDFWFRYRTQHIDYVS